MTGLRPVLGYFNDPNVPAGHAGGFFAGYTVGDQEYSDGPGP